MKIYYFAELILPSNNAYSIHVMKMCNALGLKNKFVKLLIFKNNKNINLYKTYNCKKNFNIKDFNLNGINFFNRIIFCFKLLKTFNKNKNKNKKKDNECGSIKFTMTDWLEKNNNLNDKCNTSSNNNNNKKEETKRKSKETNFNDINEEDECELQDFDIYPL